MKSKEALKKESVEKDPKKDENEKEGSNLTLTDFMNSIDDFELKEVLGYLDQKNIFYLS